MNDTQNHPPSADPASGTASRPAGSPRRGVVYACSHPRWLGETIASARSCRRWMPDLPRQLFIPADLFATAGRLAQPDFDDIVVLDQTAHAHRPRFESALKTAFDEAIFIDGDTLFIAPVYELFEVLAQFDIALAHAPQYLSPRAVQLGVFEALPRVSPALPEWNAGVIVAAVNDRFRAMVRRWLELFELCTRMDFHMDQAALRSTLADSPLRIATLPANYNFRANVAQSVTGTVKILHAHGELDRISHYINASQAIRVYTPRPDDIHGFKPKPAPG